MKRVAVITGIEGGIGRATAEAFLKEGWHVVGIDIVSGPALSGEISYLRADLTDEAELQAVFRIIQENEKRIDCLVNNAAKQLCKSILETSREEWDFIMASNIRSVFLATRHAHPALKSSSGSIVNVSSVHSVATSRGIAAYAASKGAVSSFTRAAALEFADDGIRVNAILPGAVETAMLIAGMGRGQQGSLTPSDAVKELAGKHPLGRVGAPQEIAQAILFLADSSKSGFMTGQILVVDGGVLAKLASE